MLLPTVWVLPPTVLPPLCECATSVTLDGTDPGVIYQVEVDPPGGVVRTFFVVATSTTTTVPVVPALEAGDRVRARRFPLGDWSMPEVVRQIRNAFHPQPEDPALPPWVDPRARGVLVLGVYPGCTAVLDHPGGVAATNVTTAQAGPDGRASVVLGSSQLIGNLGLDGAYQSTCTDSVRNSVFEWFQAPVWQELRGVAYAGQTELRVENTTAGSVVSVVRVSTGAQLGEAVAVHTDVIVPLSASLVAGEHLELRQYLPEFTGSVRTPHAPLPASSGPTTLIETHPAEDLAPRIVEPVFEDTETLVVEGLVPGTLVRIIVYDAGGTSIEAVFGTRRMSYESRIGLPAPLGPARALVRVVLTLGSVNLQTEIVEIKPVEAFRDPVIVPNVFECALVVQVLTVPGADVVLELDDLFVGQARCTSELAHVAVPVVRLWAGGTLVARQILPGDERTSAPLVVQVMPAGRPLEPRILPPYAAGHE